MVDDDGTEWSIEILDGDSVHAPPKLDGQTPSTAKKYVLLGLRS